MADAITIKALQDASLDAKSLEEVVNGDDTKQVTTRLGETYPSVKKAINTMFENGGLPATPFKTKALMTASALANDKYAMVTDDTVAANNGLYIKSGGTWAKTSYDPLAQANAYTTIKADAAKSEAITSAAIDATNKANAIGDATKEYVDAQALALTGAQIFEKTLEGKTFSAIWKEYNKPVWHIGNGVFVDSVGAKVKVVKEEMVLRIKAVATNQEFSLPIGSVLYPSADTPITVDWGDGTIETVAPLAYNGHKYNCEVGDEFTVRYSSTGDLKTFSFKHTGVKNPPIPSNERGTLALIAIVNNYLPKVMTKFELDGCLNLTSLSNNWLSSYAGNNLDDLLLSKNTPNLTLTSNTFKGVGSITSINNLLASESVPLTLSIPSGLLDGFINVVSAKNLFYKASLPIPSDAISKMTNLEDASNMFKFSTLTGLDNRFFINQKKLKNVSGVFNGAISLVADAKVFYDDMVRGNPTQTSGCFSATNKFTNLNQVPAGWK